MSEYTVRPWQEGDELQLMQIWPDAESVHAAAFRTGLAPDADSPWRRSIVAEHEGIPVAAATVYETSLHDQRLWAYVEVAPDHRRRGLGRHLLEQLRKAAQSSPSGVRMLRSKVLRGSAGAEFAHGVGMESIQRSRMVRIEAGALPTQPLREAVEGTPDQAVEDLATGSIELTQALWDFYVAVHQWDPPAEQSLGRVNRLFLSDQAEAFGAIVLRDGLVQAHQEGRHAPIAAFAVSYKPLDPDQPEREVSPEEPTEVLIGYDVNQPKVREDLLQLISLLVNQYPIIIEVDDAMTALAEIVDGLIRHGTAEVEEQTVIFADPQEGDSSGSKKPSASR